MIARAQRLIKDSTLIAKGMAGKVPDFFANGLSRASVLALHDNDDWAIDHVFNMWFRDDVGIRVTRANWDQCATSRAFSRFDMVLFGYYDMLLRFEYDPERSAVVIHDPCEIFPQVPDWKNQSPIEGRLEILKCLQAVIVISREMEKILTNLGVRCFRIPTMSRLPFRNDPHRFPAPGLPLKAISVYRNYPRKNTPLLENLSKRGDGSGSWSLKLQSRVHLDMQKYVTLLDQYAVYVCTSWQEGGPLPLMDALSRGALPVTTRVGQIPEFLKHGESAFFCDAESDFIEALATLAKDPGLLMDMRIKAHTAYVRARDSEKIQSTVRTVFEQIIGDV